LLTSIFCCWMKNVIWIPTKVDAAIEDGDSLCSPFCPDSLLDHIAAKVFAQEMDEELLIVV
jgi:hypothetical protein